MQKDFRRKNTTYYKYFIKLIPHAYGHRHSSIEYKNSIINAYNLKHPEAQIRHISNVPAPESLGTFSDSEIQSFVPNFISSLQLVC